MFKNKKRLFASIVATSLFLNNTGIITFAEGNEQTVVEEAEVETAEVEVSEAEEKETEVVVEEPKEEVVEEKAEEVEEITESAEESSEEMIPESQEEETEETVEEIADEDEIAEEEPEVDEETEVQEEVEEEVRVKKVYEYSDAKISVKATLQYAEAIPDDAEFVVTPITNQKAINAYFAALNKADNGIEYSEDNTVLYDVAFLVDKLDGNGKVEYEPEKGAVTLEVKFKKSQLTDDLGAKSAKDVVVNHLPLTDAVKESVDKAIDATNITAKDVIVEPVDATVKLVKGGTDTATVTLDSLSVVAISNGINAEKIDLNLDLLFNNRGAYGYGIIANDYSHGGDTESNMMVGKYYSNSMDTGNSSNYANVGGDFYVGEFASNGNVFTSGLRFHLAPTNVFLGDKAYAQYQADNSLIDSSHLASYTKIIHKQIDVASVVKGIGSDINKAVSNNGATTLTSNAGVTIDLTNLAAGTYIINTTDGNFTDSNGGFNVKLNDDQRLIVNCSATSANLVRWNLNDKQPSSYIGNGTVDDYWLESVVFNLPNATSVTMSESMGVIIAPKAFVTTSGGACGGVLVCDKTEGGNEWHYHNHHLPEPTKATVTLGVKKEYDGNWSNKKFEFKLEKLSGDDAPCVIDAPQKIYADEDNNNPNFNKFTFGAYADSRDHEYTFKVSEVPGKEAINYDETVYFVKIVAKTLNNSTSTTVTYATDSNFTNRVSEMKFTNTDKPQTTERSVKKDWKDNNNQDGKRPAELKVKLLADGVEKTTVTLNDGNGWEAKVENLPVYNGNNLIKYTWDEGTVSNYTPEDPKEEGLVTTLTNTHTPEKTEAKVIKVWNDEKNYDNKRPAELKVKLLADGAEVKTVTLDAGHNWTATITGLDKYANGKEIKYTWTEDTTGLPQGYTLTSNDTVGTVTTITNSYTPKTTSATIKKIWDDANNQDKKRPAELKVDLKADGTVIDTVTLNDDNSWTATVSNLPAKKAGKAIVYTWAEETLTNGYTLTDTSINGTITTLTNSLSPEKRSATVKKIWSDANNQDGKRPAELKVDLKADDVVIETVTLNSDNGWTATVSNLPVNRTGKVGEAIVYEWAEPTLTNGYALTDTSINGTVTTLTNSYTPEETKRTVKKVWNDAENQDGKRPTELKVVLTGSNGYSKTETLNDGNGWTATVDKLPVYAEGKVIEYAWAEEALPAGYFLTQTDIEGKITTLTNSYTPEETERSVKKVWEDAANQDGKRPAEIKVDLLADGNVKQTVTLNDGNGWTATVDKLPVYAAGEKIKYTWAEPTVKYYSLKDTTVVDTLTTLTNIHTPEETDLTVIKNWNDNENQDGYRPGSLDVDLLANDEVYTTVTLNATNDWTATVDKLPVYANGKLISYKWSEKNLPKSYYIQTSSVTVGKITTLTNTHKADTTKATITKVWDDNKNQDGKRPASLDVDLLADGVKVDTVTLNADNDWTVTVSNLPAKKAGKAIAYTWDEPKVEGYNLTGNKTEGIITTLTNTHTPEETELTVVKDWNDEKNQDGKRPLEIKVDLLADGKVIDTVTLNGTNKWTATVDKLPVYAAGEVGKTITYTWSEGKIEGYSLTNTATTTDGKVTTLTNTHTPETTERSVKKVWDDADNQDGKRPAELKVDLLADGKAINTVTLNKGNDWTATVENLPVYAAGEVGQTITYKWSEAEIKGYNLTNTATTTDGKLTTLTNTHTPETTEISGGKTWDDSDNQDGIRPKSITVKLLADGEVVATKDVTAREKWNWKFEDMPKYKNGKEIKYELAEIDVPGYKAKVEGYNIVNTHKAATTEKAVRKIWDDNNNQDGKRPAELKVVLKANGVIEREVTLNESNFWSAVIENLPVNRAGVKIDYTWEEDKTGLPEGYNLKKSETDDAEFITTLTNSYKPEEVDILGTKTWNDDDNKAGFRPDYIMINLFADDVKIDSKKVTANDKWSWSWTNLPKYAAGKVIKYTITEDKVEHYATEIYGYDVINTPTSVKVSKVDITDQKEIEGAHIKVVDKFGKVVDEWDSKKEVHIITDLTIGDTYTLIETVAPEGYTIAAETTFYINAGGRVMSSGTVTTDGVVLVEDTMTSVKISKVDVTDQKELEGAHIQIIDSKGTVVEEWDSKKEVHVVEGLKTNETYTLKETVAPIGYTITTDTTFIIDEKGNVTTTGTITEGGVILVEDAMTEVEVSKVDIVGGEELEGAHIQIIDKEGVVVKEWDSTKTPEMIRGLHTNETYTLKETVAPEGYTIATETTFIIDEKGNVTTTGTKSDEGVLLIEDAKTNVKVSKVDITDQHELEGAHIQVIDSKGVVVEEWDSTKVVHVIEGLKTNETYTLKETVAPLGYTIATENTFIIDEKGNVTTTATMTEGGVILVEDTLTEVKVSKVDIADGKELPGAKIQIINKAGEVVEEWISTTRIHVVKGLHTNEEYTLHEEVAPEGYIVATDTTFIIDENGKVTTTGTITEGGVLLIEDSMTHVEVNKIDDSPSHRLIGGAHLVLRDSKGNIVASWITEAGKAFDLIGLLCVGETYTLVEVSAPAGYDIAAPITFTIDKTGHIQIGGNTVGKITMVDVEILNDEDDVPPSDDIHEDVNTGDNSNLMLWITMFVTSAMGGLYVIYRKREDEVNC